VVRFLMGVTIAEMLYPCTVELNITKSITRLSSYVEYILGRVSPYPTVVNVVNAQYTEAMYRSVRSTRFEQSISLEEDEAEDETGMPV
jgi:hypothetical protein